MTEITIALMGEYRRVVSYIDMMRQRVSCIQFACIVDTSRSDAQSYQDIPVIDDVSALQVDAEVKILVICQKQAVCAEIIEPLLLAGVHIVVTEPLMVHPSWYQDMYNQLPPENPILQCAQSYRLLDAFDAIKSKIALGHLGTPKIVRYCKSQRFDDRYPISNQCCHLADLDLMRFLLQRDIHSIFVTMHATVAHENTTPRSVHTVIITLQMDGGVLCVIEIESSDEMTQEHIIVTGTAAECHFQPQRNRLIQTIDPKLLERSAHHGHQLAECIASVVDDIRTDNGSCMRVHDYLQAHGAEMAAYFSAQQQAIVPLHEIWPVMTEQRRLKCAIGVA